MRAVRQVVGYAVLEEYFRYDEQLTGATMINREGLNSLVEAARQRPRPFECLLMDDTSRLGRNLSYVLRVSEILAHHGVFLYFIAQQLDSRDKNFRQLLIMHGMVDEQFLVGLSQKVHRGMEGRILNGFIHGGRCYGYQNINEEDLSRRGDYGRPAIKGVRQAINPEEAEIVKRMFDMYGAGDSLATIAKTFNREGILAPRPRRGTSIRAWCPTGLRDMLRNERYIGRVIWNRTQKVRNPEKSRKERRDRPREEWVIIEAPALRIVSDEQWKKVQAQIKRVNERFGVKRMGGLSRTAQSQDYLFSGLMICGICGYNITITQGAGNAAKYGCPVHRYRGVCPNDVSIRRDRLEHQLLGAIIDRLQRPEIIEYAIVGFHRHLEDALTKAAERANNAITEAPKLKLELRRLETQAHNLVLGIKMYGPQQSPTLTAELSVVENRIEAIRSQLKVPESPITTKVPIERIREFVSRKSHDLEAVLLGDRKAAKQALRTHINPLVLTPKSSESGPVYHVTGDFDVFAGDDRVMQLVPGGGLEPPQPFRACGF